MLMQTLSSPIPQWLLNLLFESLLILAPIAVLTSFARSRLSSAATHHLWCAGLFAIAMLPLVPILFSWAPTAAIGTGGLTVFTVTATSAQLSDSSAPVLAPLVTVLYSMVAFVLLVSLSKSWWHLRNLNERASTCEDLDYQQLFSKLAEEKEIRRPVQLKMSGVVNSPVSYGLWRPVVLLPETAMQWSASTRKQILVHELSHIHRLDWLTMLVARIICALFWINPLTWRALREMNEAAEKNCDAEVYRDNDEHIGYAENLLRLAKQQSRLHDSPFLAQPMFGKNSLDGRIQSILERRLPPRSSRMLKVFLAFMLLISSISFNQLSLVAAQDRPVDQEYLPTRAIAPMYPRRAADAEVEGWALYRFTVTAQGTVDPDSLVLVDIEPAGYFERSSENALLQFEFDPRIVNGEAVAVEGVEYLFRYHLQDEEEPRFNRPPPEARSRNND